METRIAIRPGRTIHLVTYKHPTSRTTLFLIHGLGGRGAQWRDQIELLKQDYTLVIPDLYGHGSSDKPKPNAANPYSFRELDQDMHALFNKYADDNNIIIGHSYGGALAVSLAVDHQDQIRRLVLISPTACTPNITLPAIYQLPPFLMELLRPWLEKVFEKSAFDKNDDPNLVQTERLAGRDNPMAVIRATIKGMQQMTRIDVTMLTIPTLILLGRSDQLVLPAISEQFYRTIPHHRFETLDHAGHMSMLEQPARVNQLLGQFIH